MSLHIKLRRGPIIEAINAISFHKINSDWETHFISWLIRFST